MLPTVFLLVTGIAALAAEKILLLPFAFPSHVSELTNIGEALVQQKHDLYILLPESYLFLDKLKQLPIQIITYKTVDKDIWSDMEYFQDMFYKAIASPTLKHEFRDMKGVNELCKNALRDEDAFLDLIQKQFDLVIVDGFQMSRCLFVIPYRLGVPYVTVITVMEPWLSRNPSLPSAFPYLLSPPYTEKMTFLERLTNLLTMVEYTVIPRVPMMDDGYVKTYAKERELQTLNTLAGRSLLWLLNTDITLDYPRPRMPNEIMIGGLTTKPAKSLTGNLEQFMSKATEGVIVVTFGTWDVTFFGEIMKKLLSVFAKLTQKVVLRLELHLDNIPENVYPVEWLPQNDVLAHENTKLFITHCGANGQFEALYHGVPMVGIPMFGDHPYNAKRMEYHGFGRSLPRVTDFTEEQLYEAVSDVLNNITYMENIKKASDIFRNQLMTPKERAVYWIEHVLKYGGEHLRSHALDMPWYQYLMLDILAFVTVITTFFITCCIYFCKKCRNATKFKSD